MEHTSAQPRRGNLCARLTLDLRSEHKSPYLAQRLTLVETQAYPPCQLKFYRISTPPALPFQETSWIPWKLNTAMKYSNDRECYACSKKLGHIMTHCPTHQLADRSPAPPGACFICKEVGHDPHELKCPNPRQTYMMPKPKSKGHTYNQENPTAYPATQQKQNSMLIASFMSAMKQHFPMPITNNNPLPLNLSLLSN